MMTGPAHFKPSNDLLRAQHPAIISGTLASVVTNE